MRDADAATTDRDHRFCFQRMAVSIEQLGNQGDSLLRRHVREAHQSRMGCALHVDQFPKVGIDRHEDSAVGIGTFQ